jgi:UDP-N-acetylmuramoylalanine--D-glutamate ligase
MTILVEGFDADAMGLARRLATEGASVRLAARSAAPPETTELEQLGIVVQPNADLDADPGPAEVAYLDVWTPAVAPRVARLRAQGTRVSCLGDLLLERWTGPTIGITGTAGKTTATALTMALLRASGIDPAGSSGARAANLWPTPDLLDRRDTTETPLVIELTSSHLAFMATSPTIAVVTCFWPDHLELHGSLAAYREAKETIVRHQRPTDTLVLDTGDEAVASFAALAPGEIVAFSATGPVARGAFVRSGALVVRWDDVETEVARLADLPFPNAHLTSVLAAVSAALAAGAAPDTLTDGLHAARRLPYRAVEVATIAGVPVVDDGLAATPAKTSATLAAYPRQSVVLIAGGLGAFETGTVHAAPEEQLLFERACDEIARAARLTVMFGPATARLEAALSKRGVELRAAATLDEAFELAAVGVSADDGTSALLFSPMFPVDLADRERFAALALALALARA